MVSRNGGVCQICSKLLNLLQTYLLLGVLFTISKHVFKTLTIVTNILYSVCPAKFSSVQHSDYYHLSSNTPLENLG